jgi:hypothetical protein
VINHKDKGGARLGPPFPAGTVNSAALQSASYAAGRAPEALARGLVVRVGGEWKRERERERESEGRAGGLESHVDCRICVSCSYLESRDSDSGTRLSRDTIVMAYLRGARGCANHGV